MATPPKSWLDTIAVGVGQHDGVGCARATGDGVHSHFVWCIWPTAPTLCSAHMLGVVLM